MTIWRGPGGGGNATTDSEVTLLTQLEQSASQAATNAAASAATAAAEANLAKDWATKIGSTVDGTEFSSKHYAQQSSSSATASASSASASATSATNASSSASAAATSATNAASSATAAAASATEAAGYAASIDPAQFVTLSGAQTITGTKTFSQPIAGSITGNAATVTNGVTLDGVQTLTNKTINAANNTLTGVALAANTYTKTEVDTALATKQNADAELTTLAGMSANRATFLAGAEGFSFRNRIINGDMRIDQRNNGASVTPTDGQYTLDRWRTQVSQSNRLTIQRNAGSVTPPIGFTNYLGLTSTAATSLGASDYFGVFQFIEGFNVADLGWGSPSAQSVTVSFWVRSSLTGTFSGVIKNNSNNRAYPFTYAISAANTWEYKTVNIPGDTTGTWLADNGAGIAVLFGVGAGTSGSASAGSWTAANINGATGAVNLVGTNGATFYITGVQLEAGSVATPFERRPYGTELALCQRYYYRLNAPQFCFFATAQCASTTAAGGVVPFPVTMRVAPQALEQTGTAANYSVYHSGITTGCSLVPIFSQTTTNNCYVFFQVASGLTAGRAADLRSDNANAFLGFPAEL